MYKWKYLMEIFFKEFFCSNFKRFFLYLLKIEINDQPLKVTPAVFR